MPQPLILFFSADKALSDLPALDEERIKVQRALLGAQASGKLNLIQADVKNHDEFIEYMSNCIRWLDVFHFAGHAGPDTIRFTQEVSLWVDTLAAQLKIRKLGKDNTGVKLAFLNGCSTEGMVEALLNAGVHAVIGTTAKIEDVLAKDFAIYFYENIARGFNLEQAFDQARVTAFVGRPKPMKKVAIRDTESDQNSNALKAEWVLTPNKRNPEILRWQLVSDHIDTFESTELQEQIVRQARLENSLQKVNFYSHRDNFNTLTKKNKVCAFVIHGENRNGQSWLGNNIMLPPFNTKAWIVAHRTKVDEVIAVIKNKLGLERTVSSDFGVETDNIAEALARRLKTEATFIAVYNDDNFLGLENIAEQFIVRFWNVLAEKVEALQPQNNLILLLIDEFRVFPHEKFCKQPGAPDIAGQPVYLPPITSKDLHGELRKWIQVEKFEATHPLKEILFNTLTSEDAIDNFLKDFDCYESFFEDVCSLSKYSFEPQNDRSFKIVPI